MSHQNFKHFIFYLPASACSNLKIIFHEGRKPEQITLLNKNGLSFLLIFFDALILRYLKFKICWTKIRAVFACKCNPVCYNVLRQNLAICATFLSHFGQKAIISIKNRPVFPLKAVLFPLKSCRVIFQKHAFCMIM